MSHQFGYGAKVNSCHGKPTSEAMAQAIPREVGRQLEGVPVDKTFEDKLSGKDRNRAQLQLALAFCREGDTLVVHSMDRLARNLVDLCQLVKELTAKGVAVEFVKEHLTFTGKDDPMATLQLQIMGACAQFERSMILERQREGIAIAKQAGKYKGRKRSLTQEQVNELGARAKAGESKTLLAEEFGISRETLYSYLRVWTLQSENVGQLKRFHS